MTDAIIVAAIAAFVALALYPTVGVWFMDTLASLIDKLHNRKKGE